MLWCLFSPPLGVSSIFIILWRGVLLPLILPQRKRGTEILFILSIYVEKTFASLISWFLSLFIKIFSLDCSQQPQFLVWFFMKKVKALFYHPKNPWHALMLMACIYQIDISPLFLLLVPHTEVTSINDRDSLKNEQLLLPERKKNLQAFVESRRNRGGLYAIFPAFGQSNNCLIIHVTSKCTMFFHSFDCKYSILNLFVCFPQACMRIIQPFSKLETLPEKESYLLGLKRLDFNSTLGCLETLGCLHLPLHKESHKNAAVVNI